MTHMATWRILRGRSHGFRFHIEVGERVQGRPFFGRWYFIEVPGYWIELQGPAKKARQ